MVEVDVCDAAGQHFVRRRVTDFGLGWLHTGQYADSGGAGSKRVRVELPIKELENFECLTGLGQSVPPKGLINPSGYITCQRSIAEIRP
jgi:hypothetical protein